MGEEGKNNMKHRRCRAKWAVVSIDTGIFRPSRGGDEEKEADVSMVQKIGAYAGSSPGRRRKLREVVKSQSDFARAMPSKAGTLQTTKNLATASWSTAASSSAWYKAVGH